jgi:hypothetical protein
MPMYEMALYEIFFVKMSVIVSVTRKNVLTQVILVIYSMPGIYRKKGDVECVYIIINI